METVNNKTDAIPYNKILSYWQRFESNFNRKR